MAELGKAYVSVIPKMAGDIKSIIQKDMAVAGKSGGAKFAKGFGDTTAKAMKGIMKAVVAGAVVKEIGSIGKAALDSYANFEQLEGGVQKLFGDNAQAVMQNAANAFKTTGQSANEYMENVTSFSASMISSLGGDTATAAMMADRAMQDMSDNANVFGTSMESVQNAYQGFAKGQFNMLDNLKLGYGGTKEEMQRLLSDAEKLTGQKYDISNFADITEAIGAIQDKMGITGTTAKEAAGTIEGSVNMMKASWENWLTALGSGDDLGEVTDQLFESLMTAASNIIPRLGEIAGNLGTVIAEKLPEKIGEAQDAVENALLNLVPSDWMSAITGAFDKFDVLKEKIGGFISYLGEEFSSFGSENGSYMMETFSDIQSFAIEAFDAITGAIKTAMPVIKATIQIGMTVIRGAFNGLRGVVSIVKTVFTAVKTAITDPIGTAKKLVSEGINKIKGIIDGLHIKLPEIKLPHFSVTGGQAPYGLGGKGSLPKFSINWYAKGGIFDGASLIGVGERGAEAVVPLTSDRMKPFARAIAEAGGSGSVVINLAYDASADAAQMANDLAREVKRALRRG